ncbi:MAG: tRNA pseudouridine(13) synthase TruD, partial [Phycisphaeraceae bacterium]|nr:tRNA pseudouridine(13) synthase TruD [Phycisphaeraceae bacterium]
MYLTHEMAPVGGVIRERPEDFLVEELAEDAPVDESGEHLYLLIEKESMTTPQVAARLADCFDVDRRAVSFAGLKDRHAVTRQRFSVHLPTPGSEAAGMEQLPDEPFAVHWAQRQLKKWRRGGHTGNRFVIRIRQVEPARVLTARQVLGRLSEAGVPNRFGPQRFGVRDN